MFTSAAKRLQEKLSEGANNTAPPNADAKNTNLLTDSWEQSGSSCQLVVCREQHQLRAASDKQWRRSLEVLRWVNVSRLRRLRLATSAG